MTGKDKYWAKMRAKAEKLKNPKPVELPSHAWRCQVIPPDGGFPFFLVHGFSFRRGVRYTTPLSILNSSWMRRTTPNRGKQTGTESAAVGSTNHSQRLAAPL